MVRFETLPTRNGYQLGLITLDAPARLNAQNLAMVWAMQEQLALWRDDPAVVAVLVRGEGERAFCAGGDIKALYEAMCEPALIDEADAFFSHEYTLCAELRRYPKPVLAWGQGIVMGGGFGLFASSSHRVVTESSLLAMPEVAIGLFPDVGASDWLHQLEDGVGRLMALSGIRLNAHDALAAGAADAALPAAAWPLLLETLRELPWVAAGHGDAVLLHGVLAALASAQPCALPAAQWQPVRDEVAALVAGDDLALISARLLAYAGADTWLTEASALHRAGSPHSIALAWALSQRAVALQDDRALLALEIAMARYCLRHGDFREGVRAKLIHRDGAPNWQAQTLAQALDAARAALAG
ncbi:Enoyl-CoA hydratase/carnithine racemase [Andreprevotia lacus DSM 23236]|uniref:3-hydroxyisobutyryl-CoA hydrolase n=1 Tax=Andreprevotia lacus DSM 23236 TaxID=1121001 RepID=A0A1W1XLH1_9NEIS|nr:enoyl-CoA hydratase/isomerase family protein [Andreprevotia lacus]SMC24712.1 Enoyl-CoA hydratase/carnithine racemase [Andreprevotia lacus DSM 23236]